MFGKDKKAKDKHEDKETRNNMTKAESNEKCNPENNQDGLEANQDGTNVTEDKSNVDGNSTSSQTEENIKSLKTELEAKSKQTEEYLGMLQRTMAEFDNYKKRTAKEKESLYSEAVSDAVAAFLPVVDSFERAVQASGKEEESQSLKEGIALVFKQMKDVLKNLGIEEIKGVGESFDPQLHNAVMHIDDESYGENVIVEEFQKGYIIKDKVIRHSMVKVAN